MERFVFDVRKVGHVVWHACLLVGIDDNTRTNKLHVRFLNKEGRKEGRKGDAVFVRL